MAAIKDVFREVFCQLVAGGAKQRDAFLKARMHVGNDAPLAAASVPVMASNLMRDPAVRRRLAELAKTELNELQARQREKLDPGGAIDRLVKTVDLTREWVIEQLVDNVKLAKAGNTFNLNAANKALELLGRELGMFVERREAMNVNYVLRDRPPTEDEWIAEHADRVN